MYLKIVVYIMALVSIPTCLFGQKKEIQHEKFWQSLPNCCSYIFINNEFTGLLLDGNKLLEVQPYLIEAIQRISKIKIDSNNLNITIDTTIVWSFEKSFRDTLYKNKDINLNNSPYYNIDFYYRQYLGFHYEDIKYLLIGFHLEDNLFMRNDEWYYYENKDKTKVELQERTILVRSRTFAYHRTQFNIPTGLQFYVLYNIDIDKMQFIYIVEDEQK